MEQQIKIEDFKGITEYQLQYADYETDAWTIPVMLTKERLERILDDLSVTKIKLITDKTEYELDIV